MRGSVVISLTLGLALVLGGIPLGKDELAWTVHEQIITATHVKKAPTGLDDAVWQKVPAVLIPMEGRGSLSGKVETVFTKVVHADDTIYFLFKWNDPTRSVTERAWKFDGETWSQLKGDEDWIALLFEITRIDKFATQGCVITCHGPAAHAPNEKWTFATRTTAEKGDLWHWRAARSDPHKYAVDGWLTVAGHWGEYALGGKTGRRRDLGSGGDFINQTGDKSAPLFMQDPAKKTLVSRSLLMEDAVNITDYSIFKAGDVIPFFLSRKPTGSRFDVKAVSRYAHGGWTLMLSRKLDTGHEDDVVFNPRKRYSFAMAVFDGSEDDYLKAEALALKFNR